MKLREAVVNNTQALEDELKKYLPQNRLAVVMNSKNYESSFSIAMRDYPEALHIILTLLPEPDRLKAFLGWISEHSPYHRNLLNIIENYDSFKTVLDSLTYSDYLKAITYYIKDLIITISEPKILEIALERISEDDLITLLLLEFNNSSKVFERVAADHTLLTLIFARILTREKLEHFVMTNIVLLLQNAAEDDVSLEILFNIIPKDLHLSIVKNSGSRIYSKPLLCEVLRYPAQLRRILSIYPEVERLEALMGRDIISGTPLLLSIFKNEKCLDVIFELIPVEHLKALFYNLRRYRGRRDFISSDTVIKFPFINTYLIIEKHVSTNLDFDNSPSFFNSLFPRASIELWVKIDSAQNLQETEAVIIDFLKMDSNHASLSEVKSLFRDLESDNQNPISVTLLENIKNALENNQETTDSPEPWEYGIV